MEARLGLVARRIRLEAGLELLDLAQHVGVSQPTLSRFERGQGWRRETDRIVEAYARVGGVTPADVWRMALELEDE